MEFKGMQQIMLHVAKICSDSNLIIFVGSSDGAHPWLNIYLDCDGKHY